MPLPYAQNKKHIYAWISNNREHHNTYMRDYMRYKRSPEHNYEKIAKIFRHILF